MSEQGAAVPPVTAKSLLRKYGIWVGLGLVVVIGWSSFNGLVSSDEAVKRSYSQVQNVMQRQADLIPNLVESVKGYAAHENKTLAQVTEARGRLTAVAKMDPEKLAANPELQKQLIEAQTITRDAAVSLQAVREAYPDLKANQNFTALMAELAGSQNRISVERRNNQKAVEDYNNRVRVIPGVVVARATGFAARPYFEATEAGQQTPQVKF